MELEKVVSAAERGLEQERTGRRRAQEEAERRAQREEQEAKQREQRQAERTEEVRRSTARGGGQVPTRGEPPSSEENGGWHHA